MVQFSFLVPCIVLSYSTLGHATNNNTGAVVDAWTAARYGVTFTLNQLSPDAVGAFYLGRGFTLEQIKPYMESCVYTSVLRNDTAPGRIHFNRNSWSVVHNSKPQALVQTSEWLDRFRQNPVAEPALIAFRLAQLPDEQEYETGGDWNQGMLSVNLPVGSHFDMIVRWDIQGKPYELQLQNINCIE